MAQPTAAINGLPLYVPPWSPGAKQQTCCFAGQGGQWYASAQAFAQRHHVWLDPGMHIGKQLARPAHSCLHLIQNQQHSPHARSAPAVPVDAHPPPG